MHRPETLNEIKQLCQSAQKFHPVGALTKPSLVGLPCNSDVTQIDMRGYSGIVSYDSSEFLVSVRAGTTIKELSAALADKGQYLPFDPVFVERGATVGGSIASGISGPCRMLYGSLRDFMMEVALCDSSGREVRGGGKVVKNAAGFDLPKLVVGSYGRMGIITEATLKVFPSPMGWTTIQCHHKSLSSALNSLMALMAMPLPIAAAEIESNCLILRIAGPQDSLDRMCQRIVAQLPRGLEVTRLECGPSEIDYWAKRSEFVWASSLNADANSSPNLIRVVLVHHQCAPLMQRLQNALPEVKVVFSCGATVAWIALPDSSQLPQLNHCLTELMLSGIVISGSTQFSLLGDRRWLVMTQRIQQALDGQNKYTAWS